MKLTNDMQITTNAEKRASFRLLGVTTKLNPREVEEVERRGRRWQRAVRASADDCDASVAGVVDGRERRDFASREREKCVQ